MRFANITFMAFVTFVLVQKVFACECLAPWNNRAVSNEFEHAETVISATIDSVSEPESLLDGQIIKVRAERVYKGKVKAGDIVTFGQGGGKDCLWYFSKSNVGKGYLFYLAKPTRTWPYKTNEEIEKSNADPKYYVSTCGRSTEIENATVDLTYLDKVTVNKKTPLLVPLQFEPFVLCE